MSHVRRILSVICCLALLLSVSAVFAPATVQAATNLNVKVTVKYQQTDARKMLSLVNDFRTDKTGKAWYWNSDNKTKTVLNTSSSNTLGKLTYDYDLEKVAMQRAAEVALRYSHTRPDNTDCFTAYSSASATYYYKGENIAAGYGSGDGSYFQNYTSMFEGWKEENEKYAGQGHRRNMLNSNFTTIGIAHVVYGGAHYWAMELGKPSKINSTSTTAKNSNANVKVSVATGNLTLKALSASETALTIKVGESVAVPTLTATCAITDHFPSSKNVKVTPVTAWKSKDTSIATIASGKVTGKADGTAAITATFGGKTVSCSVRSVALPKRPANPKAASASYNSIKISWSKVTGATGYVIYYSTSKDGSYSKLTALTALSFTHKELTCGKVYYYKVRAYKRVNGKNFYGPFTAVFSAKPVPGKVTLTAKKASGTSVSLTWGAVSGGAAFEVYRATSADGTYTKIATTKDKAYTDTKLAKKTYYYKVRAYRVVNGKKVNGSFSAVQSVKL